MNLVLKTQKRFNTTPRGAKSAWRLQVNWRAGFSRSQGLCWRRRGGNQHDGSQLIERVLLHPAAKIGARESRMMLVQQHQVGLKLHAQLLRGFLAFRDKDFVALALQEGSLVFSIVRSNFHKQDGWLHESLPRLAFCCLAAGRTHYEFRALSQGFGLRLLGTK